MKTFTLLFVAIFSIGVAYATNPKPHHPVANNTPVLPPAHVNIYLPGMLPVNHENYKTYAGQPRGSVTALYDSIVYWKLDTPENTWNYINKATGITYNASDYVTNYILQEWTSGAWVNEYQYATTYNSSNYETNYVTQAWVSGAWENDQQYIYTYNTNGYQASYEYETWSGTAWVPQWQWLYTYDSNGNDTDDLFQAWKSNNWADSLNNIYTYNSNDDETSETDQVWQGAWVNIYQYLYTYNSASDLLSETDEIWGGSAWDSTDYHCYYYNSANYQTGDIYQYYNSGAWQNSQLDTFFYNSSSLETLWIEQIWDDAIWENYTQNIYTYNGDGYEVSDTEQNWSGAWVNNELYTETYNVDNYPSTDLTEKWVNNNWVYNNETLWGYDANNITTWETVLDYNSQGDSLTKGDSTHYYFITEGINQLSVNSYQLSVYPNPAGNFFHVGITLNQTADLQLRLVNILGQTVWSVDAGEVSSYQKGISVADLAEGVYLLEMVTGGGMETREVVVQR